MEMQKTRSTQEEAPAMSNQFWTFGNLRSSGTYRRFPPLVHQVCPTSSYDNDFGSMTLAQFAH